MFPPSLRASPDHITDVMRFGKKNPGSYGYIRYKEADSITLAVIVPKMIDKRSSKRNLLKRRARTIMTQLAKKKPVRYTIVYYATQPADFNALHKELTELWPQ